MEAVQKTPEREAFYKKIDGEKSLRAVECAGRPRHAGAAQRLPASSVEVRFRSATT